MIRIETNLCETFLSFENGRRDCAIRRKTLIKVGQSGLNRRRLGPDLSLGMKTGHRR
jgi:hypothetical protein